MNLLELMMAAKAKVISGSDYLWDCFGKNSRYIDFGYEETAPIVSSVFDATTQEVYVVEIFDTKNDHAWRYIDPRYKQLYVDECRRRNVNPDICWDDKKFVNIDNIQAILLIDKFFNTGEEL